MESYRRAIYVGFSLLEWLEIYDLDLESVLWRISRLYIVVD